MLTLTELIKLKKQMVEDLIQIDTAIMLERYAIKFKKEPQPITDEKALELMTEVAQ